MMVGRVTWRRVLAVLGLLGALGGCSAGSASPGPSSAAEVARTSATSSSLPASPSATALPVTPPAASSAASDSTSPAPRPEPSARPFDPAAALGHVRRIAAFGPRDAASDAYASAAAYVADELEALGYEVQLQSFRVPAGVSWGVQVPAGRPVNVIAAPQGLDASRGHVVIGAHLDTVPQAPGAEDNASGVAVLLELARMLREEPAGLPVRLVAFGAEESRGSGASMYAFGSRHYVDQLSPAERRAVRGMVSVDRVGVRAAAVPVCWGGRGTDALAKALRGAAAVPTTACRNRASDHVAFEGVGIPAARLGSVPYDAYHSRRDVVDVVDARQLARTGSVLWSWLRSVSP